MIIKSLGQTDSKIIADFFLKNFSDGWTESMILSAFNTRDFFAVGVFSDTAMIGVITYTLSMDTADIEDVVVDSAHRRKGIAKTLLSQVEEKIKKSNITKIFLEVRASNIPAIGLYEKSGYKRLSVRKKYYADGEDAVVMVKEL